MSVVPLKDRRLLDVKLGELTSWIMMRDFTPSGIGGAFQRGVPQGEDDVATTGVGSTTGTKPGYQRYYNKYINVKKGGVAGVSMVLAAYILFNYCRSYKELKHERHRKYH